MSHREPAAHRNVTVRFARPDEAAALAALGARTFREAYGEFTPREDLEAYIAEHYTPEVQEAEVLDPERALFVAERAGEPVGFALLGSDDPAPPSVRNGTRTIQLERIYVVKEAWRTGAGSALLEACLAEARARGFETVWLSAWSENHRALAFYRRHGFRRVGTHPFRLGTLSFLDPVLAREIVELQD